MSGIIYPTCSFIFLRVGLNPTRYLPFRRRGARRDVGSRGRSIDERRSHGARTTDRDQEHVGFKIIITAGLEPRGGITRADRVRLRSTDQDQTHVRQF